MVAQQFQQRDVAKVRGKSLRLRAENFADCALPPQAAFLHQLRNHGRRHRLGVGAQMPLILGSRRHCGAELADAGYSGDHAVRISQDRATQRRPGNGGNLVDRRVKAERVGKLLRPHQPRQERLPRRRVECRGHAAQRSQAVDDRRRHRVCGCGGEESDGGQHHPDLAGEHQLAAIEGIRRHAAAESEQEDRGDAEGAEQAERKR